MVCEHMYVNVRVAVLCECISVSGCVSAWGACGVGPVEEEECHVNLRRSETKR